MYFPLNSHDWKRALGLAVLAAVIWLYFQQGWKPGAWQVPAAPRIQEAYTGDELELLIRIKAAQENSLAFLTDSKQPRFGAPWTADWSSYAMPDTPVIILAGQLAKLTGLIPAANTMLLLAHVLAVLAFYFCSRALGHRPVFAAAAALLFGFCYFNWRRSLVHFSFTLSFIVPLILLVAFLAGSSRKLWHQRRWWLISAAIAGWTGVANPYYGLLFLQLICLALICRHFTLPRVKGGLWRGWGVLACFLLTLVASNWSAILALDDGNGSPLVRNYAGTEIYGLRFIELFIPPPSHRWFTAAALGRDYAAASILKGEFYYPYLGIVGIVGLMLVVFESGRRLLAGRFALRPAWAPLITWILLYACTGGLNSLLAFGVTPLFRGTNRFSIFILALILLALASWATRRSRRLPRGLIYTMVLLVSAVGLWDQCLSRRLSQEKNLRAKVDSDRQLGAALEKILPPGAMIFQLPAIPFLEHPAVYRMLDYELGRPYLFTHTLRFSYGLLDNERSMRWQERVARKPVAEMCSSLEAAGFSALYIQKAAFPDAGGTIRRQLEQTGRTLLFEAGDHLVYALQASSTPRLPSLGNPALYEAWIPDQPVGRAPSILVGRGWYPLETDGTNQWRWAGSEATMLLHNPSSSHQTVEFSATVSLMISSGLKASLQGESLWESDRPVESVSLNIDLPPGFSELTWQMTRPAKRTLLDDPRVLGMMFSDVRIKTDRSP